MIDSDILPNVYDLVAAVYRQAIREAQGRHERKRQAAVEWLAVVAPDWQERIGGCKTPQPHKCRPYGQQSALTREIT